jgi:hypothetical protein
MQRMFGSSYTTITAGEVEFVSIICSVFTLFDPLLFVNYCRNDRRFLMRYITFDLIRMMYVICSLMLYNIHSTE